MMNDIFSSFDPFTCAAFSSFSPLLFWLITFGSIVLVQSSYWITQSNLFWLLTLPTFTMFDQTKRTFGFNLKGFTIIMTPLFIVLISINFMGLLPYVFSFSSHLLFTLSLGLPLWLSLIMSGLFHSPSSFAASLLPSGAPDWLNPFLVLIESISISVRPITLSFRLAANMSAGHIVLGLIGIYTSVALFTSTSAFLLLASIQIGYLIFEMGICLIQAYIFCLLLTLYSDDHPL
nr:ATP synthase subunit 6 [Arichlidon gathofi]